jgi:hypothetical protein
MTRRALAHSCLAAVTLMSCANFARAGVWVTDPVLGLAAEFSTNPGLLVAAHTVETHGAVLIDAPTSYHANSMSLTVLPSLRITDSSGYSSLASDYEHLTVAGELDGERNTLTATAQVARDSSLYYDYLFSGSTGVRRDTTRADVTWVRALTERFDFNADVSSSRVLYGQSSSFTGLTDYRYSSANPTLLWNTNERTTLTVQGGIGLYDSLDRTTRSVNSNIGLGFKRQLNELWSLSATTGYSRESNMISEYYGPFLLGVFKATDVGTVFSADVTHQGALLKVTGTASRSLVPTGFSFLARQDAYQLGFEYPRTERWTFAGHVRRLTSIEPQAFGPASNQSYIDSGLSASWLFTEKWSLTLRATWVSEKYTPPGVTVAATGFTVQLSRHFNTIKWQ